MKARGKQTWANDAAMIARFCACRSPDGQRIGEWPLARITEDTVDAFDATLSSFAASTRNQYVQLLKASFRCAARKGYLARSPISEDSALKRTKVAQRRRRVVPDVEQRLLDAVGTLRHGVGVRLQCLIIAAIETGCRRAELLAAQWMDVNQPKATLLVRAVERGAQKTGRSRLLPISARLAGVLAMAKLDPAGREYPPSGYVFGEFGAQIANPRRRGKRACCAPMVTNPSGVRRGALNGLAASAPGE